MEAVVEPDYESRNEELLMQSMFRLNELLQEESLPPFPFLPQSDLAMIDEIRRTLVVVNIDYSVSEQELIDFFGSAGVVKYLRFCLRRNDPTRYCLVEFSSLISIIKGLKMNNQIFHGRKIKVYHSTEAIEKPSFLKDPEYYKQYLLDLIFHVEDSYKIVEKAAKDVSRYEDYCSDNPPSSKSPLKNPEIAIAEIEEALSKVLSAQSLISVAVCPVESDLLNILGETLGNKESILSSPEALLKYATQKLVHSDEEELTKSTKKEVSKSRKTNTRSVHRRHRTRSKSREKEEKYHSRSASSGVGRSHRQNHHEERLRTNDNKSGGHTRHSSLQTPSVISNHSEHSSCEKSHSTRKKSSQKQEIRYVDNETKEVSHEEKEISVKSIQKVSGNEAEKENDNEESNEFILKSTLVTSRNSSEKTETSTGNITEEDSYKKSRHRTPSKEGHSHQDRRSRSRSSSGRRRLSKQKDHHKSPLSSSRKRSPSNSDKDRRGRRLHRRRSRSPLLEQFHHYHHHARSRSRHSGSPDHHSRRSAAAGSSSRRERRGGGESREGRRSGRRDDRRRSPRGRRRDDHGEDGPRRRGRRAERPAVGPPSVVRLESCEDYPEESSGGEEDAPPPSSQHSEGGDAEVAATASVNGSPRVAPDRGESEVKVAEEMED